MFTDILSEELIKVGLESQDKEEAFEELLSLLVHAGKIQDFDEALNALLERESQQSTGIGEGLGVPHGRLPNLDGIVGAMGISKDGVEFESIDGQPVHVVFLLLAEQGKPGETLQVLAEFARLFSNKALYQDLCKAKTPKAVLECLKHAEIQES